VLEGEVLGAGPLLLKAEGLQRTGSFKVRGAFNAVLQLSAGEGAKGVITLSAGNHGLALATAARTQGIRCVVVLPDDAPRMKVAAIEQTGAEMVFTPRSQLAERVELERERRGLTMVHPFDDPHVIAGQGTIGLEILEAVADLGTVVVPVGGGGLIAGIALVVKAHRPRVRVLGVEPEGAAVVSDSLRAGAPLTAERVETIADGLGAPYTRSLPLGMVQRYVDEVVRVSDVAILAALRAIVLQARVVVEPAGAAAVAAVMEGRHGSAGGTTIAVLTGSNVDPMRLSEWIGADKKIPGRTGPGI
jgi:threonine dehydratase